MLQREYGSKLLLIPEGESFSNSFDFKRYSVFYLETETGDTDEITIQGKSLLDDSWKDLVTKTPEDDFVFFTSEEITKLFCFDELRIALDSAATSDKVYGRGMKS